MKLVKRASRSSMRWLVMFTLLLLASTAVPVLADSPPSAPEDLPAGAMPDGKQVAEGLRETEVEEAAEEVQRETAHATEEREESLESFANLSPADSKALVQEEFAEQLAVIDEDPARMLADASIEKVLSPTTAQIKTDGTTMLLDGTMPVRAQTEGGELSKVNLDLVPDGQGFTQVNPLVQLELPSSASEGVTIGNDGLSVEPVLTEGESVAQRVGDTDVFYPETQTDTDILAMPTASGVELFSQLRSVNSPEKLRFDIDPPDGAVLRMGEEGGAEVERNGEVLTRILAPTATDAQGADVPVAMEVDGNAIVLEVAHREMEVAYPLLVDPAIAEDWATYGVTSWYGGNGIAALENGIWSATSTNWGRFIVGTKPIYRAWGGANRGLYITATSTAETQWAYQNAQISYTAPGKSTYITAAGLNPFWRDNHGCEDFTKYPEPHDYMGLWSPAYNGWTYFQKDAAQAYGYAFAKAPEGWSEVISPVFVMGLGTGVYNTTPNPCWRDIYAGGAYVWMSDPEAPTLDPISGYPSGWIDDSKSYGVNVSAHDPGLGVQNVYLLIEGNPRVPLKPATCYGIRENPCPSDMSGTINFNGDNFDEGKSLATVVANDALAKASGTQSWWVSVDSTPPKITLSGQLANVTEETEGNSKDPKEWDRLSLPVYNLTINAEDGSSASNKTVRSGVKNIEIYLDKKTEPEPVSWKPNASPCENCGMNQTYPLKLTGLSAGKHTLRVVAVDQMNHLSERDIEFKYIPATGMKDEYVMQYFPLPDGSGNEAEEEHPRRPELAVNVMNGNLVFREKDVDVEGYGADLEVERFYNSQLPDSQNTEWGDGWTLAQTPELEPENGTTPKEADLVDTSGGLDAGLQLPTEVGKSKFDPALQATVTKEAGGGYELADESGESNTAIAFDSSGRTDELRTDGYAKVDYGYEAGKLAEIAVKDPASASDPSPAEEGAFEYVPPALSFKSAFGAIGSADGQLKAPADIAIAANGDLFVLDRGNNRIERFNQEGKFVSKFGSEGTGNGQFKRPCSIAIDPSGYLWVADADNNRIEKFNEKGEFVKAVGVSGTGNAQFSKPEGIATDLKGNVYVADTFNSRIQELNSAGEFVSKVGSSGTGNGQFNQPAGLDIGPGGKLWVADRGLNRVTEFDAESKFVAIVGSQGVGNGQFQNPEAIEVDSRGNVFVGDRTNNRVQQFSPTGKYLAKFGSQGTGAGQFNLSSPMGIAVDNLGGLWVTDVGNNRIQKWSVPNYRPSWFGAFGSLGAGDGQLKAPGDIAFAANGDVFIVDKGNNRIERFNREGKFVSKFGSAGAGNGQFSGPTSIAIDGSNQLWITDGGNNRVQVFTENGEFIKAIGSLGTGNAQFNKPEGVATNLKGEILVADTYNKRVQVFDEEGKFLFKFGSAGSGPGQFTEANAIDVGRGGRVWVADWGANRVEQFNEKGEFAQQFGSAGTGAGQFSHPDAIEADGKGNVFVGDQSNGRVELFNESGEYVTQFGAKGTGEGQFSLTYPMGIAVDWSGGVWATDVSNNRIQKWLIPNTEAPKVPEENDPSVDVKLSSGLVSSVEGKEAGVNTYAHTGELLTANKGPNGEVKYEYDASKRLSKVTLPNGTWGSITYNTTYGRVSKVTVDPAGAAPAKSTNFAYEDSPSRRTTVSPEETPTVTYEIGADGSVLEWQNVKKPPTIENISGSLYADYKEGKEVPTGLQNLKVKASSPEGIASIQVLTNGTNLVDEMTCPENKETIKVECEYPGEDEWVMETEDFTPGLLNLEVLVKDELGEVSAERFHVTIPQPPPPPPPGFPATPKFNEIKNFREEFGLDVWDPVKGEPELNDRIFDLINAWTAGDPVARASWERWGVPLRTADVAELEYREWYYQVDAERISQWVEEAQPSGFAGYYIDQVAGGIMHIGFLDKQSEQLVSLKASLSLVAGERLQAYPTTPTTSYLSVRAASQSVSNAIDSSSTLRELVVDVKEDEAGKAVRVGTPNVAQVKSILDQMLGTTAPVVVEYDARDGTTLSGRFRKDGRMRAGDAIFSRHYTAEGVHNGNTLCTAGFGAKNKADDVRGEAVWQLFVLTAGHCNGASEDHVYRSTDSDPVNESNWKEVGMVSGNALLQFEPVSTDAEAISVEGAEIVPQGIFGWNGNLIGTPPAGKVRIGRIVCFSGARTQVPQCGPVVARSTRWVHGGDGHARAGYWVKFARPATHGDSGAPVWAPGWAGGGSNVSVGLVTSGRPEPTYTETLVQPLLTPYGMDSTKVPGILHNPRLQPLSLKLGE